VVVLAAGIPAAPASAAPAGLSRTEVRFRGDGGVLLHGTVITPIPDGTRRPGLVLLGGSDWKTRDQLEAEAEAFARHGVSTMVYDKRTVGYSQTHRDYGVLATDALAALESLRSSAAVDPARVGLWGLSEGAWVAPLAASRSSDVAFVVTAGAVGMSPAQQSAWYWGNLLRHDGVSGSMLRAFAVTGTRFAIGAGLFPEADYDPVPLLQSVRQPVLALWGVEDINHPPAQSSEIMRAALERGGNRHYTIGFIPDAGPDLHRTLDGGFDHLSGLAPGYPELVVSWITGLPDGPPVIGGQPVPHQDRQAVALAPLSWYESVWAELAAWTLMLLGFGGYLALAAVRRIRNGRRTPSMSRAAFWLAACGLCSVVGFLGYLGFLESTGARAIGPVLSGRPLPWLALQLLAGATVVAGFSTGVAWGRRRGEIAGGYRVWLGSLMTTAVVFVPWAAYWGLLMP
jgi:dienelactone hydrolase